MTAKEYLDKLHQDALDMMPSPPPFITLVQKLEDTAFPLRPFVELAMQKYASLKCKERQELFTEKLEDFLKEEKYIREEIDRYKGDIYAEEYVKDLNRQLGRLLPQISLLKWVLKPEI